MPSSRRSDFILVGGVAGVVHGSARATYDVDVVYSRKGENIERLAQALAAYSPYLRDAPPDLPFSWDAKTIRAGLNFTLTTSLGDLDLFGDIQGGGSYEDLLSRAFELEALGVCFKCLTLPALIRLKEAAGRLKDQDAIAELRALLEESEKER